MRAMAKNSGGTIEALRSPVRGLTGRREKSEYKGEKKRQAFQAKKSHEPHRIQEAARDRAPTVLVREDRPAQEDPPD